MGNPHDTTRTFGQRTGDRLLALLGSKFVLAVLCVGLAAVLCWFKKITGTDLMYVFIAVMGAYAGTNSATSIAHIPKPGHATVVEETSKTTTTPVSIYTKNRKQDEDDG